MLIIPLQIDTEQCIDCVQHGLKGDWSSAIACGITLVISALIRHFEKKRIKKDLENKKD